MQRCFAICRPCAVVDIIPRVRMHGAVAEPLGEPCVMPLGNCKYELRQALLLRVPIEFGARAQASQAYTREVTTHGL